MSEAEVECSICGLDGYPPKGCEICHGSARVQPLAHTLSYERTHPSERPSRYGPDGDTAPKRSDPLWAGVDQR